MAGENKIVHRISLEGADKVAKQLEAMGAAGQVSAKQIQSAFDHTFSNGKAGEALGGLGAKTEGSRIAAERFREVIHTLHPILDSAGLGLGNLGAFARVAGAGMAALGATIAASVLLGLAKVGDEADKAKRRLDSLSGAGKGGGESQFWPLKKDLKDLHADLADVAPLAETFFKSQQDSRASNRSVIHPPGWVSGPTEEAANRVQTVNGSQATPAGGLSSATYETAIKSILEAGRISRATNKESSDAFNEFYGSTKGGKGQVSVEAFDKLTGAVPALADAVAKAASGSGAGGTGQEFEGRAGFRAFLERGGKFTGDQSVAGLARAEPEIRAQSAKVPVDFTETIDRAGTAAKGFAEKLGDATLRASKFLNKTPAEILGADASNPAFPNLPGPSPLSFSAPRHERTAEDADAQGATKLGSEDGSAWETSTYGGNNLAKPPSAPFAEAPEPAPPLYRPLHGPDPYEQLPQVTNGPRSEAAEPVQPQQGQLQSFIEAVSSALNKAAGVNQPDQGDHPSSAVLGVRGEAIGGDVTSKIADLGAAAEDAAAKLRGVEAPTVTADQPVAHAAIGGHIRGPGTSTSDSIPAMLSDGEYVVKAAAVNRIGVDNLDAANNGVAHFAEGGLAGPGPVTSGEYSVTYDPDSGGAYINGNLYPPGSPILDDPKIKAALDQSKASMKDESSGHRTKHKSPFESPFVGTFGSYAEGGLVGPSGGSGGGAPSRLSTIIRGFANGGIIDVPHFAAGGMPDMPSPNVSKSDMQDVNPGGIGGLHPVTLNLPAGGSVDGVYAKPDAVAQLRAAASQAKRFSTGSKPSWYGGTGR